MKLILLAFFVAAAVAVPIPDDDSGNIDVIVNGVPEGEALDIEHLLAIHTNEKVDGELVAATNALHPFTAVGLAEAAVAAEVAAAAEAASVDEEAAPITNPRPEISEPFILPEIATPEVVDGVVPEISEVIPSPVVLPEPAAPVVIPDSVVMPEPAIPEVVESVVESEAPASPIAVPEPALPEDPIEVAEVVESPQPVEALPQPELQTGEVFNNGVVSVEFNPQEPTILSTLQNWFNMVVNYVSNGITTQSSQIV